MMRIFQRIVSLAALLYLCLIPSALSAQDADSTGSADHPLITHYAGSFIDGYAVHDFDAFRLPLGAAVKSAAGPRVPAKKADLEGKITRILYRGPEGRSTLEILRNYRSALEQAGFETLFSCAGDDCGFLFHWTLYHDEKQRLKNSRTSGGAFDIPQDIRYFAAKGIIEGAEVHVSVLIAFDAGFGKLSKRPVTLLEVIESEAMETGMVTVNAEAIGKGIDADGHFSIYGVYFNTDSAEITPESAPALAEISKLLARRTDLKILVVGHTDNQGGFDHNMDLSRRRAESVVKALTANHGIAANRLTSDGVGYLAPVATNDNDAGRAKNRRVELVKN